MTDVIDATGKFAGRNPKRFRIKSTVTGTISMKEITFEFLAVVFWCWLRKKGLNITAPVKFTRKSELEIRNP